MREPRFGSRTLHDDNQEHLAGKRQGFGLVGLFLLCRPKIVDIIPRSWDNEPCFETNQNIHAGWLPRPSLEIAMSYPLKSLATEAIRSVRPFLSSAQPSH